MSMGLRLIFKRKTTPWVVGPQLDSPPPHVNDPPLHVNVPPQVDGPPAQVNVPPQVDGSPPPQVNVPPQVDGPSPHVNDPPPQVNDPLPQANVPLQVDGPPPQVNIPLQVDSSLNIAAEIPQGSASHDEPRNILAFRTITQMLFNLSTSNGQQQNKSEAIPQSMKAELLICNAIATLSVMDREFRSGPVEDLNNASSDDAFSGTHKRNRTEDGTITPAADRLANLEVDSSSDDSSDGSPDGFDSSYDDINMDDFMDMDDDFDLNPFIKREEPVVSFKSKKSAPKTAAFRLKEEPAVKPAQLSLYNSLDVESEDTVGPLSTNSLTNPMYISALKDVGSKLYFIGKLKDRTSDAWVSCCVKGEGDRTKLKRLEQDEEGNIHESDIVPSQEDIDEDFDLIQKAMKIKSYRAQFVKRKYTFGEQDIPTGKSQ
ncbi:hypothetical protein CVT25_003658 [Psilocybe cyanescens]|uniref:Uncharacterized protein n=1 Tax=Psilocybe cyanescens TaxID=93625 RepID=A0A409WP86_PSICY|nr:hypothetical protein CVT25_003658 [Psilocybe cyanescens]